MSQASADTLPIWAIRDQLIELLRTQPVVVVEGATGCGKSTQVPRMLFDAGVAPLGRIGVTQPRRIACLSVSHKIANDMGAEVGGLVGYKMRFVDHTSRDTRIKVMTDGILIQEMQADPELSEYDVLLIDEAHERSLNIDIILGLLKALLERRRDLRLVISSATIDPGRFSAFFDGAPILSVDVRPHPVKLQHIGMDDATIDDLIERAVDECAHIVNLKMPGDILVFLTGEADIKLFVQRLEPLVFGRATILPLYARLSREEQERVFDDVPGTKIVVATNIAETSVTIDGIDWVIDSGRAKINAFNPRTLISSLEEQPISRASAEQRKGRTGRTRPGTCIRLYSQSGLQRRPRFTPEEILRSDLAEVVLRMLDLGIRDIEGFAFPTPPKREAIPATIERLRLLGAIDERRHLTDIGRRMARFPLDPRIARIVIEAMDRFPDVMREVLVCCAFLSTRHPFLLPLGEEQDARRAHERFADPQGDFIGYLRLFDAYERAHDKESFCARSYLDARMLAEIANVIEQLEDIVRELGGAVRNGGATEDVLRALVAGLAENLCRRSRGREYETLRERRVFIHPGSFLREARPAFMVCGEIVATSRVFARSCSPVHARWIAEVSPLHRERWLGRRYAEEAEARVEEDALEIPLGEGSVRLVARGKRRVVRLDLLTLARLGREAPRERLIKLGRLRVDVREREVSYFHGEPLLAVVDFARAAPPPWPVRQIRHLHQLLDPVEDLGVLERFASEWPRFGSAGRSGKRAGIVTLFVGERDVFWLDLVGNPAEACFQSAQSLEALERVLAKDFGMEAPACLGQARARLAAMF